VKIYIYIYLYYGVRVDPGPTLARPHWPGVSLTPGQGQLRSGPTLRARVRASKNGLDPARPGPRTVYVGRLVSDFELELGEAVLQVEKRS
jgi:hypothetical protein